jgi:hypothetical protein
VAALGGTVHIDSTVGKGTTVTCVLPQDARPIDEPPGDEPLAARGVHLKS